jgi:hypothetical protein
MLNYNIIFILVFAKKKSKVFSRKHRNKNNIILVVQHYVAHQLLENVSYSTLSPATRPFLKLLLKTQWKDVLHVRLLYK